MQTSYDIWMIKMTGHPVSEMYSRIALSSWQKLGYKVNTFEAVTPKDLCYKHKLTFDVLRSKKPFREHTLTEKAVWYSHFELWCKCLDKQKPIVIIEHDSKLVKQLPDLSKEGYKFLSYIDRDFGPHKGIHIAPGSGYYITPNVAERLIAKAVCRPITKNSDGHIATLLNFKKQVQMNDYLYIEQINIDGLNTIDHKNPSRNYTGLDYENIDIPGIHG